MASARPAEQRLRASDETQINLAVAVPLNARLDALVAIAEDAGDNTSRKEIVSALLLEAPDDANALAERLRRFRQASVQDSFIPGFEDAFFLNPDPRSPGPRRRRPAR